MVSGLARVNSDLPPFFLYAGFNVVAIGLNVIGLRRAGFSREQRQQLKAAYKLLYRSGLSLTDAVRRIQTELPGPDAQQLLEFLGRSKRGIAREAPGVEADQMEDEDDEQNSR